MRISKYKVYDADTETHTAGESFVTSKLEGVTLAATANEKAKRWAGVPAKDIISVVKEAAVAADAAFAQTFTAAGTIAAGDVFRITIQYQGAKKSFKHVAVSGAISPTAIAAAFRALINADSTLDITATGTDTLILTATAGAGIDYIITPYASGAATLTGSAVTDDAVRTDAGYFAAKHEGVDADDFGAAAADYVAYYITYSDLVPSAHGKVVEERVAAIFIDADNFGTNESGTILEADLNAASYVAGKEDLLA